MVWSQNLGEMETGHPMFHCGSIVHVTTEKCTGDARSGDD